MLKVLNGHYNKFWAALVPLVAYAVSEFTGNPITPGELSEWVNEALILITPVLVYLVPNKGKE